MSVSRAYDIASEGDSRMAALAVARTGGPGLVSRLAFLFAFLFVGLCAWAWANNNSIVAWSLSQGLVGEAATRTLPGVVKVAAAAGGILGLAAAGLAVRRCDWRSARHSATRGWASPSRSDPCGTALIALLAWWRWY